MTYRADMNLKIYFYILLLSLSASSFSACATGEASSGQREQVVLDDGGGNAANDDEITISEKDLNDLNLHIPTSKPNSREAVKIAADRSEITTMYDGYGNKTETRYFKGHSRLKFILVRTSASGETQTFVYGYGNEVKNLPENLADKALNASADELANAAGVYETQNFNALPNFRKKTKTLQPLPSYEFPVQPRPLPAPDSVQPEQSAPAGQNDPSDEATQNTDPSSARKPEEMQNQ